MPFPNAVLPGARLLWLGCFLAAVTFAPPAGRGDETPPRPPADPDVLKLVPDELAYRRQPLPDGQNVLLLLKQARDKFVKLNKLEKDAERWFAIWSASDWTKPFPKGEDARRLKEYLDANRRPIALMDEAIARGRLQLPEYRRGGDRADNELAYNPSLWHELRDVRMLHARRLFESKRYGPAVAELQALLRFGELLRQCDGIAMHQRAGRSVQCVAASGMEIAAGLKAVPDAELEAMLGALGRVTHTGDKVADGLRVDFWSQVLPELTDLPADGDLGRVVSTVIDKYRPGPDPLVNINPELDALKSDVLALLKGHPAPFDRAETVRLAALGYAAAVQNLQRPWPDQRPHPTASVLQEVAAWPEPLALGPMSVAPLYLGHERKKVSAEELAKVREQLRRVRNPLGKHLLRDVLMAGPSGWTKAKLGSTARLEVARCIIAIRLYERRHGTAPAALDALVTARILPEVPRDPFDGQPLRYSRDRAILWSVGPDGKDDGGEKPDPAAGLELLNLLRPPGVPELPKPPRSSRGSDLVWDIPSSDGSP
jgi:hypothetical protein